MTIPQAAVDAAKQVLLNEGCLDQEHYPGYRDAVVTAALEAAMPHLRAQIAEEIRGAAITLTSGSIGEVARSVQRQAARIAEGENK